jgi:hypothetical protein
MSGTLYINGAKQGGGIGGAASGGFNDDVLLHLGTDADGVLLLRSAILNADTALTSVLIGTPDTHALAANSVIIANATADGDVVIIGNDGGTSRQILYADVSAGVTYLGMKDGTPGDATGVGDVYVAGKLEVDGTLYPHGNVTITAGSVSIPSGYTITLGTTTPNIKESVDDSNARYLRFILSDGGVSSVPVVGFSTTPSAPDFGLFDGITQPLLFFTEKANQLHTATNGTADAGGATAILKHTGGFTNAVVGDIVRITAGTNCTAGWYWITTVTSADQVTLDRNYTSANTTNCAFVTFHSFPMIGADGVCLKSFYGMPTDSNFEIDRDGWMYLNAANNQLGFRSGTVHRAVQNAIKTVEAVTTTNVLTEAESGSVFTNLGDADGATCQLPADAKAGTCYTFSLQVAQALSIIIGKAAGKFYLNGTISTDDGGADMIATADDEGELLTLCCDGDNGWFPLAISGTWTVSQP